MKSIKELFGDAFWSFKKEKSFQKQQINFIKRKSKVQKKIFGKEDFVQKYLF